MKQYNQIGTRHYVMVVSIPWNENNNSEKRVAVIYDIQTFLAPNTNMIEPPA